MLQSVYGNEALKTGVRIFRMVQEADVVLQHLEMQKQSHMSVKW
jgi:hypothetical protein